jgi:hypothetical protein
MKPLTMVNIRPMYADSDPKEAVKWYRLAAAQGYEEAQYKLGTKKPPPVVAREEKTGGGG